MGTQQFCLKWNNHQTNMLVVFEQLLSSEALVDVTLACEGLSLKAHKVVLSACSPFFQSLFLENPCKHPIVILKDMKYIDLKAIIDFMYRGEVNVSQDQLSALLKTAETLKVKGLAEVTGEQRHGASGIVQQEVEPLVTEPLPSCTGTQQRIESPPLNRKKRGRPRRRSRSDSNCSDTEDQVPSKIKEPDSPEIVEEISRDAEASETRQRLSASQAIVPIPHQSVLPVSAQKSMSILPSVQDSHVTLDEQPSGDDTEFEMEPSALMEQSMADTAPVYTEGPSQGAVLTPVSNQLPISSAAGLADAQSLPALGPCGDSQALVPCSIPSEPSTSSHIPQDTTQDIKPVPLVSFEEPPISPVAGPSHQDSSSSMMYMDSSVSMPGPSNFQLDKQQSQSQQSQPQEINFYQCLQTSDGFYFISGTTSENAESDDKVQCSLCQYVSASQWDLRRHHITTHTGICSYKCTVCCKTFLSASHLKQHMIVHKGVNSFQCSLCEKSFTSKKGLSEHSLFHTGERPHHCPHCEKTFQRKSHLRRHILLHTGERPYTCGYCYKTFSRKHHLSRHMSVHTGERPHQCSLCGKSFNDKHGLQVHIRVHTGERPYSCSHCTKTFLQRSDLVRHALVHLQVEEEEEEKETKPEVNDLPALDSNEYLE